VILRVGSNFQSWSHASPGEIGAHQPLERGVQSDKRSANIGNRNRHLDAKAIFPHEVDIDNKSGIHLVDSILSLRRRFCVFGVGLVPI